MACVLALKWKETQCQNTVLNSDYNVAIFIIKWKKIGLSEIIFSIISKRGRVILAGQRLKVLLYLFSLQPRIEIDFFMFMNKFFLFQSYI